MYSAARCIEAFGLRPLWPVPWFEAMVGFQSGSQDRKFQRSDFGECMLATTTMLLAKSG